MARKNQADLIRDIMSAAQDHVKTTGGDENKLFALLGTVPATVPTLSLQFTKDTLAFNAYELKNNGKMIFEKFKKYLKKVVCDDFDYCSKREKVDENLKKYLPEIIKLLIKRIPISGKLPAWLVTILSIFGISASSLEVVLAILIAWLIIKGCNELCQCKQ